MRETSEIMSSYNRASNMYNANCKELANIKKEKAVKIIKLLEEHKTVSKAELYFSATEEGQKEVELSMLNKGLEKIMQSLNAELRSIRDENWQST